jgi:hypothetical protein
MSYLILPCLKCLESIIEIFSSIDFLCENRTVQFGKLDSPIFPENSYIHSFGPILFLYPSDLVSKVC